MKTDRELLELAAKAVGLRFAINGDDLPGYVAVAGDDWRYGWTHWNPLTNDGDALRLALKLGMASERGPFDGEFYAHAVPPTRRAIVRAAAEIGSQS